MVVVRGVQLGWRGPGSGERDIAKKKKSQKRAGEVPPSIDPKFKSQYCKTKQNKK
jgi:hypothetical protein